MPQVVLGSVQVHLMGVLICAGPFHKLCQREHRVLREEVLVLVWDIWHALGNQAGALAAEFFFVFTPRVHLDNKQNARPWRVLLMVSPCPIKEPLRASLIKRGGDERGNAKLGPGRRLAIKLEARI